MNRNQQTGGLDGRFRKKQTKTKTTPRKSQSEEDTDTSPEPPTTKRQGTIDRGRPRLTRDQTAPATDSTPGKQNNTGTGTLTINTDQMSESDIDQTIKDSHSQGKKSESKITPVRYHFIIINK